MRKTFLFMNVSLDGYMEGPGHDISSFHQEENPFEAFSSEGSAAVDTLLFGRKTFEMMKSYWPTPEAKQSAPEIASFMNENPKVVVSHHPFEPGWDRTILISGDVIGQLKALKGQPGKTIAIFGSNNLCVTLLQEGLLDELQIMVNPVILGGGTPLFAGLPETIKLRLVQSHTYKSGTVLLTYEPA